MLDRKFVREHPDLVREALRKRGMVLLVKRELPVQQAPGEMPVQIETPPLGTRVLRETPAQHAVETPLIDALLEDDAERRSVLSELEALRNKRNVASKEIGRMKDEAKRESLKAEVRLVNERIKVLEAELAKIDARLSAYDAELPNIPDDDVPFGKDDSENVVIKTVGEPRQFDFEPIPQDRKSVV